MKKNIIIYSVIIVIVLCILLVALKRSAKVKVVLITNFSSQNVVNSSELNSAKQFEKEYPKSPLKIIPLNDYWIPESTLTIVTSMKKKGVRFFVTSHPSRCAIAVKDEFTDGNALVFHAASTTPVLSRQDDYSFRLVPDAIQEQTTIARYCNTIFKTGGSLLVIQDNANLPYTDPAYKAFASEIQKDTLWTLKNVTLSIANSPMDTLDTLFKQPVALLYILVGHDQPSAANLANIFHSYHPNTLILMTPWGRSQKLIETAGPAAKNIIMPSNYQSRASDSAIDHFFTRFEKEFGYTPHTMSIGVYQGLEILQTAIQKGYHTPEEIKHYIMKKQAIETRFGTLHFDSFGDISQEFSSLQTFDRLVK